jgi:hypothetical protein
MARRSRALAARVDAFVGAQAAAGQGSITADPAPEPGCIGGGCHAPGTVVTLTQAPAASYLAASRLPNRLVVSRHTYRPLQCDSASASYSGATDICSVGLLS